MTKLEQAFKEADQLPPEARERLGDDLLHYIHRYLALRNDLNAGLRELDSGLGVDAERAFANLKARYGA